MNSTPSEKLEAVQVSYFDMYGVKVSVHCSADRDLKKALDSFTFFRVAALSSADITIYILQNPFKKQKRIRLFRFKNARAYGFNRRHIAYSEERCVYLEKEGGRYVVHLYDSSAEYINDLLYVTMNSLAGWILEKNGWIRLHAVSYPSENETVAITGDSGIGKSGYALKRLRNAQAIFSDEITLIAPEGAIYPWPIPIQIDKNIIQLLNMDPGELVVFPKRNYREKWQYPVPRHLIACPARLGRVETPHSLWGVIYRVTLGLGLPQILEYQLRADNIATIIRILMRRFIFIIRLQSAGRLKCRRHSLKN